MKTLSVVCCAFALFLCSPCNGAEYVTLLTPAVPIEPPYLCYSENLILAAGDSATLLYLGGLDYAETLLEVQIGGQTLDLAFPIQGQPGYLATAIAGPAILRMKQTLSRYSQQRIATFSVTRANSAANVIPANAVVIPEDAGGQYQVVLESSTDLLNWAVANPGTYGGSTQRRFFRTRILKLN
jgi:hypothetical protein